MVSSNASLSPEQIAEGRLSPSQPLFFQLYKHGDNTVAAKRVREVEGLGYQAIFLTVDAPVSGNRERDIRAPYELEEQEREGQPSEEGQTIGEMHRQPDDAEKETEGQQPNLYGTAGTLLQNMDLNMTFKEASCFLSSMRCLADTIVPADDTVVALRNEAAHCSER